MDSVENLLTHAEEEKEQSPLTSESISITTSPFPRLQIFLDLDDCLVNTERVGIFKNVQEVWNQMGFESFPISIPWQSIGQMPHIVVMRPGLRQFLSEAHAIADLYIFTQGIEEYATKVAAYLDPSSTLIQKVWSRESVCYVGGMYTKDLTKLEGVIFNPKRGILIDNDSFNMLYQPHNGIISQSSSTMSWGVTKYHSCSKKKPEDNPLLDILTELQLINHLEDIRPYLRDKYQIAELIKATHDSILPHGWEREYCIIEEEKLVRDDRDRSFS